MPKKTDAVAPMQRIQKRVTLLEHSLEHKVGRTRQCASKASSVMLELSVKSHIVYLFMLGLLSVDVGFLKGYSPGILTSSIMHRTLIFHPHLRTRRLKKGFCRSHLGSLRPASGDCKLQQKDW